ncbi:hypothetical protein PICSAR118_04591 [Mycobacterium avium subsp. paratuberculosis]|nr:hypothetical protein PICSAR118_04591 [Mycobacterium avium subsp. paratuberculosis]
MIGLPLITTRPVLGSGWVFIRLSLALRVFISVHTMIEFACENTTGLRWPLL